MIVYPARGIRPFVMYCVNGKPRSSLLIESTDSMILRMIRERQVILKAAASCLVAASYIIAVLPSIYM